MKTSGSSPKAPPKSMVESSYKPASSVGKYSITTLRYDRNSPGNFSRFERDLSIVGGLEFGALFEAVRNGS